MLSELYWGKYPIIYPRFNVVIVGKPDEKLLNFLKRIMPDKTSVIDVNGNKWYDNVNLFKNYIQMSFPGYIDKSNNNNHDKTSLFNPVAQKKEDKFRIICGEKDKITNGVLTTADMIFFLDGNHLVEYLNKNHSITMNNWENLKDSVYFIIDKRQERSMKVSYSYKVEFDRYV